MDPKEINEFLAKELFGITEWCEGHGARVEIYMGECCICKKPTFKPNYYHDITQSLGDGGPGTVVGKMRERGYRLQLFQGAESTLWFAVFFKGIEKVSEEMGDTPSAAINLAAVEALKAEKEEGNG